MRSPRMFYYSLTIDIVWWKNTMMKNKMKKDEDKVCCAHMVEAKLYF